MEEKRIVAVFDFDGTLTVKDTLLEFIKFTCGTIKFTIGFLLFSPLIVLMKIKLYSNEKCKQKLFSFFFKGMTHKEFQRYGELFSDKVEKIKNESGFSHFQRHINDGADVYVVSASIEEWVAPFCNKYGVKKVIGTKIEVDANGILTGRFSTPNCYGEEKVNRFKKEEPDRSSYHLYAYGDSRGDKEMMEYADEGVWI